MYIWHVETPVTGENNKRKGLVGHLPRAKTAMIPHKFVKGLIRRQRLSLYRLARDAAIHHDRARTFHAALTQEFGEPDIIVSSGGAADSVMVPVVAKLWQDVFWLNIGAPKTYTDLVDLTLVQAWSDGASAVVHKNAYYAKGIPHHITPEALAAARLESAPVFAPYPGKKVLALIGGEMPHSFKGELYDTAFLNRFCEILRPVLESGAVLFITNSRRTPKKFWHALKARLSHPRAVFLDHDAMGRFSYPALLAHADSVMVTADSMSMQWEAAATTKPLFSIVPWEGRVPEPQPQAHNLEILLSAGRTVRASVQNVLAVSGAVEPISVNEEFAAAATAAVRAWLPLRRKGRYPAPRSQLIKSVGT